MNLTRRGFVGASLAAFAGAGCQSVGGLEPKGANGKVIAGFDQTNAGKLAAAPWTPFSEKKVRVGIAGHGVCRFGCVFGYQNHPNVTVVACTDLDSVRCAEMQKRLGTPKTFPSCEEMIRSMRGEMDAVYIATDAPSHIRLAILALENGYHVCSAVPAFFGKEQLDDVPKLVEAANRSGKLYMMNETTAFRPSCYAMRKIYEAGLLGKITYTEGEYFHEPETPDLKHIMCGSYRNWRVGCPPQYYPTHSNAYYTCVTHKRFTEVTCSGVPSRLYYYHPENNAYKNPYGAEYAMLRGEDGSAARMLVNWDTLSYGAEMGRVYGELGCYVPEKDGFLGWKKEEVKDNGVLKPQFLKPQLPPGMPAGGHGGSHGYLTDDFIRGILVKDHTVCVDLVTALNTTIAGVYAHLSAMKDGETLKIPAVV